MPTIRHELPADILQVRLVNEPAFARPAEADVVDRLRATCAEALSLVAEEDDAIVGHILFAPTMTASQRPVSGWLLGSLRLGEGAVLR